MYACIVLIKIFSRKKSFFFFLLSLTSFIFFFVFLFYTKISYMRVYVCVWDGGCVIIVLINLGICKEF